MALTHRMQACATRTTPFAHAHTYMRCRSHHTHAHPRRHTTHHTSRHRRRASGAPLLAQHASTADSTPVHHAAAKRPSTHTHTHTHTQLAPCVPRTQHTHSHTQGLQHPHHTQAAHHSIAHPPQPTLATTTPQAHTSPQVHSCVQPAPTYTRTMQEPAPQRPPTHTSHNAGCACANAPPTHTRTPPGITSITYTCNHTSRHTAAHSVAY